MNTAYHHYQMSVDPWALASSLGLDPQRARQSRSGQECFIKCPEGCQDRAPKKYFTSLCVSGASAGLWKCYGCGAAGSLDYLARQTDDDGGRALREASRATRPPPRAPRPPIQMPQAWEVLAGMRGACAAQIEAWALRRGWPAEVAAQVAKSQDVVWAGGASLEDGQAERLRSYAVDFLDDAPRPLLVALREASGQVASCMRRWSGEAGTKGELEKTLRMGGDLCPCELPALGEVVRAAHVLASGGVVLVVEGEADYLAAQAMAEIKGCPWKAVLGAPSCEVLWAVGQALLTAWEGISAARESVAAQDDGERPARPFGRVVLVPHLGDKGRVGEVKMRALGGALGAAGLGVGTWRLGDGRGKTDLSDELRDRGVQALFDEALESLPQRIDTGEGWISFGEEVWSVTTKEGEAPKRRKLARELYPVASARSDEGGAQGVRYRYHDRAGAVLYGLLSSGSWVDKSPASKASAAAGAAGVQIEPRAGVELVMALGRWDGAQRGGRCLTVTATPGWHREGGGWVYVHGDQVLGAERAGWAWVGGGVRAERAGQLAAWQAGVRELVTTPGLALGLGLSLAGALLRPLTAASFTVHLYGRSGSGKSTTTYLAASVWGSVDSWHKKWSATGNRTEEMARARSGAVLVLDELKLMKDPEEVGRTIHRVADGHGRDRLGPDGLPRPSLRWSVACLSTGENSLARWIGDAHQGGHAVRGIDVGVDPDDPASMCTESAEHAQALELLAHAQHGHAGPVWAAHLASLDADGWARLRASWDGLCKMLGEGLDIEAARILRSLALVGVALGEARRIGLIDLRGQTSALETVAWALERVTSLRGAVVSPEERAWSKLRADWQSAPAHFPAERDWRSKTSGGAVWGVAQQVAAREVVLDDDGAPISERVTLRRTGWAYTTQGQLEAWGGCKAAGVEVRAWLAWLAKQERAVEPTKATRVGGVVGKWWQVKLEDDPEPDPK